MLLLHIGAFALDADSHQSSPWHRLTPKTRILCALLVVFAVTLTPNGQWETWAIYGLALLGLVALSRVTAGILLKRVAVELVFMGVVLVGTLFREGGTVLWQWGWLRITTVGLVILGSVAFKALLCLLMLNLLVLTTSIPALLQALVDLKTPPLLVAIFASMYRYIGVLVEEVETMRRAATSRNLMGRNRRGRLVIGNMIGALFVRTYDRGDRIHRAMLSRGYQGLPPVAASPPSKSLDIAAFTLTLCLALLGQAIGWV